ncbi:MAG: ZIP family metal transporter [Elusimicrobia bacterium]|nr:ZIP family metal transporter [Elusimicrobiota bacterium]
MTIALLATSLTGSALLAGGLYKLRPWSRKELWRVLAFGSATLLVSGFNLLVPSVGKWPLMGAISGFAFFFTLESYAVAHSCPEYLEECHVHGVSGLTALALMFHSLLDGVILGVSGELGEAAFWSVFAGMAVHKFADAMTMLALFESELKTGFWSSLGSVIAITLATPAGAMLTSLILPYTASEPGVLNFFVGFSAGSLIYVGASDILPRLHRLKDPSCFVYFLGGLASMSAFLRFFHHQ